jgi:predicted dehydrogenase
VSRFAALGAAIVGTGFMAGVHADALRRLGVRVVGCVGSRPEKARAAARARALPEPVERLEELLERADVHVVHVTSPNHAHAEHVRAALAAGKHVVCEKPLARTIAEADELTALAAAAGRLCAVNLNNRFYGQVQELRELRRTGALGDVHTVHGSYLQDWLLREADWNWRVDAAQGGPLRAVGDIGVHWLDLAEHVTGERIAAVCAATMRLHPQRAGRTVETEDAAHVLLRFANGACGTVAISQVAAGRLNALSLEVHGTAAAAAWMSERAEELWIGRRDEPAEVRSRAPRAAVAGAPPHLPPGHPEGFADTFVRLHAAVYGAALGDETEYPTFADGRRAAALTDAIGRSAAEGRWVPIAD